MGQRFRVVVVVLALGMVGLTPAVAAPASRTDVIVVLEPGVRDVGRAASAIEREYGADVSHVYAQVLHGFAASVPDGRLGALRRDARTRLVELDGVVHAAAETAPTGVRRIDAPAAHALDPAATGAGVTVGILDTGIADHEDLRIQRDAGTNCTTTGGPDDTGDVRGHGTHVAGTVAALDNEDGVIGVAPEATLVPIKVLGDDGSGKWSWIICGLDHAARTGIDVANLSLSGSGSWNGVPCPGSASLHMAVCRAIAAGTTVIVAAGNNTADASTRVPAAYPEAITVSAIDDRDGTPTSDVFASFSNYGSRVDIAAPGVYITSTVNTGGYDTKSGTSMAAPHVAGVAALVVAANPDILPAAVLDHLLTTGLCPEGLVPTGSTCAGGWPNDRDATTELMVDAFRAVGGTSDLTTEPPPSNETPNTAPTASFTYSCTDPSCSFTDTSTDSDGSIAFRSWSFGDGASSTATNPSHTYGAGGTYTVTLTVTDDGGATNSTSQSVTVTAPQSPDALTLTATGGKTKGTRYADLTWSPVPTPVSGDVELYRDGRLVATTSNDGSYRDTVGGKGGGSATYMVCHAGTYTCSNEATATW